ncbi:MAG: DUF1236 domain-containing protein [Pseudolabrys sp.]
MKKVQLLTTAAAALLLTAGAVSAQQMKKDEAPAHAPAVQQKAPAEKVAPPMQRSERKAPETTGQAAPGAKPFEHKAPATTGQASPEMKSGSHKSRETTGQASPKTPEPAAKPQATDRGGDRHHATTGQGAASGSAKLTSEQRTKITSAIHRHKVASVHLNVSVRVGTRVPASVHFYPLPVEVVDIYPEWRGYDYILVGDEIVVIDPRTHEIVAVLEA